MAGPFLSHSGLAEHASQFDFPRMGRLAFALAVPPDGFFLHHRDSRPIHLHVEDTNRLADNPGQFQLQGFLDLGLFPLSDIGPDGFRAALDRFRSYFEPGQKLSSARGRDRTVPPGLPGPACGAPQVRIPYSGCPVRYRRGIGRGRSTGINSRDAKLPRSPRRSARLAAPLAIVRLLAARASQGAPFLARGWEFE